VIANGRSRALETLSARQLEVATLVAAGHSSREIAEKLALSPRTVEAHIAAIFEKLGVRSRSRLAAALATSNDAARAGNLPVAPHALVGRAADISGIAELVSKNALVTVVGTGGIGKTQASIHVAESVLENYADGVWFLELASLESGEYIALEIARVFNLSLSSDGDPLTALTKLLASKRALLVFDSCEHVIGPACTTIAAIVRSCPEISILATSRELLGISGEHIYRLPSLAPSDARTIFIERAQRIDNRIVIDDDATRAIDEICRSLDHIPLAIELAAARTNVFSPVQLLQRLASRFALLDGGRRDVLPRHQSLSALIDWSYDQLEDRERRLLRRVSIFCGRFSLEAAFAISGIGEDAEVTFLDTLSSLIAKSLIVAETENNQRVYRLLETTRAYARRKLDDTGERDDVACLHARFYARTLHTITTQNKRWGSREAIAFFHSTLSDIRAALGWALRTDEIETGAQLLLAIHYLWSTTSVREGIELIEAYLAAIDERHASLRARLLAFLSEFHWRNGSQDRAYEAASRAVLIARGSGDETALGDALVAAAISTTLSDPKRSHENLREAEALTSATEMTRYECRALRARLTYLSDDYELAIPLFRRLIDEAVSVDDAADHAQFILMLAVIEHRAGRYEAAVDFAREAVARIRDVNERWALAMYSSSLTAFLVYAEKFDEAREVAIATLTLYDEIDPQNPRIATLAAALSVVLALCGDWARAARMNDLVKAILQKPGFIAHFARDLSNRCDAVLGTSTPDDKIAPSQAQRTDFAARDVIALLTTKSESFR
jgi:predicted ATPase/DNA-binding CsgD family transcriptional regulator